MQPKLLLVDDDVTVLAALQLYLEEAQFSVDTAASGFDALRRVEEERYDLVLLDQIMPGMHGVEVLRLVRQTHSMSDLPIILLTAETEANAESRARAFGVNDYITKPVEMDALVTRIETQLMISRGASEDLMGIGAAI